MLGKAALTFWSRPRCREVEKKESEEEAEQLQVPGIEGGRPAEHDASGLSSVPSISWPGSMGLERLWQQDWSGFRHAPGSLVECGARRKGIWGEREWKMEQHGLCSFNSVSEFQDFSSSVGW